MAENKQYITQVQENGTVMISEEVISTIVAHAASEVDGVVMSVSKGVADSIVKKALGKGMKISISEENEISIEANIVVAYGYTVLTVAKAVQDAIVSAVESMTGVKPAVVNVNICGIVRQ